MAYQLPSSFQGWIMGAVDSLKAGRMPTQSTSTYTAPKIAEPKSVKKPVIIEFEDWTRAEFESQPTDAEIDEAYKQIKWTKPKKEQSAIGKWYARWPWPWLGWIAKWAESAVLWLWEFGARTANFLSRGKLENWKEWIVQSAEDLKSKWAEAIDNFTYQWYDKPTWAWVAEWIGGQIPAFLLGGKFSQAAKFWTTQAARLAPKLVSSVAEKAPWMTKFLWSLRTWLSTGLWYDVATEWKPWLWTALWVAWPLFWAGVKWASKLTWVNRDSLAQGMQLDAVLSPSALTKIGEKLWMNTDDTAKWFLNRPYQWTLKQIREQVTSRKSEASGILKDFFQTASKDPNLRLQSWAIDDIFWIIKKNIKQVDVDKATRTELSNIYKEYMSNGKSLSPFSAQRLKQIGDDGFNMLKWDWTARPWKIDLANSVKEVRRILEWIWEKYWVKIGDLNKEIQIGSIMEKDLFKRELKDMITSWLKLGSAGAATAGTTAYIWARALWFDNPAMAWVIGSLVGMSGGAVLQNTAARTWMAKYLQKNASKEITELDRLRKLWAKWKIPDSVLNSIYNKAQQGLKLLPVWKWTATKSQTVYNTPSAINIWWAEKFSPNYVNPKDYLWGQ